MLKKSLFFCLFMFLILKVNINSQTYPRVIEDLVYKNQKLNLEIKFSIYLPPDYYINDRSYPVLYMLHGAGGGNNDLLFWQKVDQVADKLINNNNIGPLIIVMPTMGPFSFYVNWINGPKWEDAFVDFINFIDNNYKTKKDHKLELFNGEIKKFPSRGIAGISMGGFGALSLGFKHPDLFNSAISMSGGLFPFKLKKGETPFINIPIDLLIDSMDTKTKIRMDSLISKIFGKPFDVDYWNANNPFNLIDNIKDKNLRIYLFCGDHDEFQLYYGATIMHKLLLENKINSTLEISYGKHDGEFWTKYLEKTLQFFNPK